MRNNLGRLLIIILTYLVIGTSLWEPESLAYKLFAKGGAEAYLCLATLALANTMAALDMAADMMRAHGVFAPQLSMRMRIVVWMFLASSYVGYSFVLTQEGKGEWLQAFFLTYAAACTVVAVVGAIKVPGGRHKNGS